MTAVRISAACSDLTVPEGGTTSVIASNPLARPLSIFHAEMRNETGLGYVKDYLEWLYILLYYAVETRYTKAIIPYKGEFHRTNTGVEDTVIRRKHFRG